MKTIIVAILFSIVISLSNVGFSQTLSEKEQAAEKLKEETKARQKERSQRPKKFLFKIKTKGNSIVGNILIEAKDIYAAIVILKKKYPECEILEAGIKLNSGYFWFIVGFNKEMVLLNEYPKDKNILFWKFED